MIRNIFEEHTFLDFSTHAKLLYLQASQQTDAFWWERGFVYTPLGIDITSIHSLAIRANVDLSQYRVALEELVDAGYAAYSGDDTQTLWLPNFFDFHEKPKTPRYFAWMLHEFGRYIWTQVKQDCGRDLRNRAKDWGGKYEAIANHLIAPMIRKPRKKEATRRKKSSHLKLIKTPPGNVEKS